MPLAAVGKLAAFVNEKILCGAPKLMFFAVHLLKIDKFLYTHTHRK